MTVVYDADALLDLVPTRPRHDMARRLLRGIVPKRGAVAPALVAWEVGNVLAGALDARTAESALEDLLRRVDLEVPSSAELRTTMRIARRYHLTFYDAAYVATTERRPDRLLITEDARLLRATRRHLGKWRAARAAEACALYGLEGE